MSMSVFLGEMNIWVGGVGKIDVRLQCGWESSNPLRTWIGQKAEEGGICHFGLPAFLCKLGPGLLPLYWILHARLLWFSDLHPGTRITPPTILGLQLAAGKLWNFSASWSLFLSLTRRVRVSAQYLHFVHLWIQPTTVDWKYPPPKCHIVADMCCIVRPKMGASVLNVHRFLSCLLKQQSSTTIYKAFILHEVLEVL